MQEAKNDQVKESRQIAVWAGKVAMGTLSSRVLGLVRDVIITSFFSRTATDAFFVAFRIPNMLRRLLGEGAMSAAFIPVFSSALTQKDKNGFSPTAKALTSGIFSILLIILTTLTGLGILFAPTVVGWFTPGDAYLAIEGKFELTVRLARIMFVFIMLISLYAFMMGILNSVKRFALPALAPTLFNISLITAGLLPKSWVSVDAEMLAWGVVVGGFLQMAVLIPSTIKSGYWPRLTTAINNPEIRLVFKNMLPSIVGLGIIQLTVFINTRFASELPEGTISWLYVADRILELPLSLFAVSMGTAMLPTISKLWAQKDVRAMSETSNHYLRLVFFLALPAAVGAYVLAEPIIQVIFERQKFTSADTANTAAILRIYGIAIFTYSAVRILAPTFYAIKNTWYPAAVSSFCLLFHIVLARNLIEPFGVLGLATSTVMSASLNMLLLFAGYYLFIGYLDIQKLLLSLAKFSVSAAAMGIVISQHGLLTSLLGDGFWGRTSALLATITVGGAVYFVCAHFLKTEELRITVATFRKKL
jgi:putative peptidoglycan lipid II flippase